MSPSTQDTHENLLLRTEAPAVEYVRVSGELALVRVQGTGVTPASTTLLALDSSLGVERFEALPDPVLGELGSTKSWRAAWAVPVALLEHDPVLALETPGGELALGVARERRLHAPCRREVVVRGGRPYLRFIVGIITAALVPVALPSSSWADSVPPCPAPLVRNLAPVAPTPDGSPRPDCVAPDAVVVPAAPEPAQSAPAPAPAKPKAAKPKPKPKPHSTPRTHVKPGPLVRTPAHKPKHRKPHHAASPHAPRPTHRSAPVPRVPRAVPTPHARSLAPAPVSVPSPVAPAPTAPPIRTVTLDTWGVPTELLPIYQAAANAYGVPWTVLAAVNKIETAYGQNLNVSSAGARGWMQFMPATWAMYGVDADGNGLGDPANPADAIFAAARYLAAAGGAQDIRKAIFAYNHAGWYVDQVMKEATSLETVPQPVVDATVAVLRGSSPVAGQVDVVARPGHSPSVLLSAAGALPVIAPVDGRVVALGNSGDRGRYVTVEDAYGNRFTWAHLGSVPAGYPIAGAGPSSVAAGTAAQRGDARTAAKLLGFRSGESHLAPLRVGARVTAGTMLGRLKADAHGRATTVFSIRSAQRLLDPAPVLHAWRAAEKGPAVAQGPAPEGTLADAPAAAGAGLLLNKERLARRVLADDRVTLSPAARRAIETGQADFRALDTIELLADAKLRPSVSSAAGTTLEIEAADGAAFASEGAGAAAAKRLTDRLEQLQGGLQPGRIVRGASHVRVVFPGSVLAIGHAANVQAAADRLDRMRLPYVWGGGHVTPTPAAATGLDCSSSVSWVLQRAGFKIPTMTSGEFARYGDAGPGRYVTIYANATHVFMAIGGRFFGTSGFGHPAAGTGAAWFTRQPSPAYLAGFTQRHLPGL